MESINSWMDENEVRKLAEELTAAPVLKVVAEKLQNDDNDDFVLAKKQNEISRKYEVKFEEVQAMKASKSSILAEASAMAVSVGLIGKSIAPTTTEVEAISPSMVNPEKEIGTFEEIDIQLTNSVKAKGICVIDRDGDVLYSSLQNHSLVAFIIYSMMGTKLMQTEDGEFGNIRIKISAGEYLEFVSVKTTRGVLVLAVAMDHILGNTNAQYVAGDVLKIADQD
jgi:hypothetical protein